MSDGTFLVRINWRIPIDTAENCAIKISKLGQFESDSSEAFEDVAPESGELSFKDVCLLGGGEEEGRGVGKIWCPLPLKRV